MAQRASSTARTTTAVRPDRAARSSADASADARAIPLDLTPIVEPYKGSSRRLAIRVERVPPLARLSRGRNNGDGSWSLATDELEGLAYIAPDNFRTTHTLSVRVVSVEDAATVAVLDYAVSPSVTPVDLLPARIASGRAASNDIKLSRIEDELERVRAALTAHESVLAETLQKAGQVAAGASQEAIERELTKARADWEAERDRQLGETASFWTAELQRCRDSWQAEHDTQLVELGERARKELEDARERWQSETAAALAKAERNWKSGEAARLAAVEAQWKEHFATKPAPARVNADEAAARERLKTELNQARHELSDALSILAERESALAQSRLERQQEIERLKTEKDAALRAAERTWKAEEEKRLAQAEARWRAESETLLAELKTQYDRAEASLKEARAEASSRVGQAQIDAQNARDRAERELRELKAQFSTLQKRLVEREAEISQLVTNAAESASHGRVEIQRALRQAEESWQSEEAARLAAAKAIWRKDSVRLAAEARADGDLVRDQQASELARLREDLAAQQASLAEREVELDRMRKESEQTFGFLKRQSEDALRQAERAWKTEEAARLSVAKAQWNDDLSDALAEATQRYQQAETALAQQRSRTEADLRRGGDNDHLNREVAVLQAALATCEKELAQLRAALGETQDDGTLEPQAILDPLASRNYSDLRDEDAELEPEPAVNRALLRDVFVIALVVVVGILALPVIESYLPYDWQVQIAELAGSVSTEPPPKVVTPTPPRPPVPQLHMERVTSTAHMRESPSSSADIVANLTSGTEVAVFEQQGKWTRVQVNPRSAMPTQGWVFTSRLAELDDPGAPDKTH